MNCSKCSCTVPINELINCIKCSNPFYIACSSLANLTGDAFKKKSGSWICLSCESARLRNKKSPITQSTSIISTSLETDFSSKINQILAAVN